MNRNCKYTKELLEPIVKQCKSVAQVMRQLDLRPQGGTHTYLSNRIKTFGLDTSHFTGQGWNHGGAAPNKLVWQKILVKRSEGRRQDAYRLRRALIESGREYKCEICEQDPIWNNKELRLQVDHINSDWLDDRPENVRFICPNCHTQTDGYNGSKGNSSVTKYKQPK